MDRVVQQWENDGLLVKFPRLCNAFPVFLIPKADGGIRPIIDFSEWTPYIETPRFSLLSAANVVRRIPHTALLVKIDLKNGFHQLPINPRHYRFNGIYYKGQKYALTRLPMGHALAPGVFQRFSEGVLRAVKRRARVETCAYLDDWLLWSDSPEELRRAIDTIKDFTITINEEKSILDPVPALNYLGFRINAQQSTIKLLLPTYDRLVFLLRHTRRGSEKDRQRIHGFCSWVLYNLRLPSFLARDVLRGDPSWLQAALQDLRVLQPKNLADPPLTINLYTDATPHSIAAIIPTLDLSYAQAFETAEEINRAEMIAAIKGLMWASEELQETTIVLHTDNAAVFSTLRSGTGRTFRYHDVRKMFLSMLHGLGSNTYRVEPVIGGSSNPADLPSRQILQTLHLAAGNPEQFIQEGPENFRAALR